MPAKIKLAFFLVPALAAILFLAWWRAPSQVVLRRVDSLLELVEARPLRLDTPEQIPLQLEILVAPAVEIDAPRPLQAGIFTRDQLADILAGLHGSVASCGITRGETTVHLPTPDMARVAMPVEVRLSWGRGSGRSKRYHAELRFAKSVAGWHLDRVHLTEHP